MLVPRRFLACLWAVAVWGGTAAASAEPLAAVRLHYARGAPRCPDQPALRRAVAARLGYDPFDDGARATLTVSVRAARDGLAAHVELRRGAGGITGVRDLRARDEDCRELAAAMVLAISIAIDPMSMARPAPSSAPARLTAPATVAAAPPASAAPAPPRVAGGPSADRLSVATSAGFHLAVGEAPGVAPGLAVRGTLGWARLSLTLEGRAGFPVARGAGGGAVDSSVAVASLLPCLQRRWLRACGVVTAGVLWAHGRDLPDSRRVTSALASAGVRVGVELRLVGKVWGYAYAEGVGNLARTTLLVGPDQAWRTPPLSGGFGAGLGVPWR